MYLNDSVLEVEVAVIASVCQGDGRKSFHLFDSCLKNVNVVLSFLNHFETSGIPVSDAALIIS